MSTSSEPGRSEPGTSDTAAPDLVFTAEGPLLVRGPVVVELPDGSRVRSDRPVSALCTCRRTRRPPFCDTSHRRRTREVLDHDPY